MLYYHTGANYSYGDPRLMVMVGCSHQGLQSTASAGDVIRVTFSDDAQQQGVFDVPMLDADGGGYVTSMWVHFVLAFDRDGTRVFVDGRDVSGHIGFPKNNRWIRWAQTPENIAWPDARQFGQFTGRDMKGSILMLREPDPLSVSHCAFDMDGSGPDCSVLALSDADWCHQSQDNCESVNGCASQGVVQWCDGNTVAAAPQPETLVGALTECAAWCTRGGYAYMGLQWSNQCFCDNEYGRRGLARDGSCDADDDGVMDCGYGVEITPSWARGGDSDSQRPRKVCGGTNAIYDVAMVTADVTTGYVGCYHDSHDGARDYQISTKTFAGMTFDDSTYTRGGRNNDTGTYLSDPISLPAGDHHFHAMGAGSGWADGNYFQVWLNDATGTPSSVLIGGATEEESCVSPNADATCTLVPGVDCGTTGSTDGSDCAYTPPAVLQAAGCFSIAEDYCASVDATTRWAEYVCRDEPGRIGGNDIPGGCLFVAAGDAGPASCTSIAQCDVTLDAAACGAVAGCESRGDVLQAESCDPLGVAECAGADIGSRSWFYSREACVGAWSGCNWTPASDCNACEVAPQGPTFSENPPWNHVTADSTRSLTCPLTLADPACNGGSDWAACCTTTCNGPQCCTVVGTSCMLPHCANCAGSLKSEDKYVPFTVADGDTVTVLISVQAWGNAISWEITDQELAWVREEGVDGIKRRQVEAFGPVRGHPTLGSAGPDAGWFSSEEYTGSIANIQIYWRPVSEDDAACIYKKTENLLTTCVAPEKMRGRPYYSTMDPRDMSADWSDMGDRMTLERCANYCADYQYFGAQYGGECYCDNEYGQYGDAESGCADDPTGQLAEYGITCAEWMSSTQSQMSGALAASMGITVPDDMCTYDMSQSNEMSDMSREERRRWGSLLSVFEQQGSYLMSAVCPATCGTCGQYTASAVAGGSYYTECDKPCNGDDNQICGGGWRNSVYEITGDGMEWTDWNTINGESQWCVDAAFGVDSSGIRAECQCRGQGKCANEREPCVCINADGTPGEVRFGRPSFNYVGCYVDHGRENTGMKAMGDTYFDHDFGVTFDGEGDYIELDTDESGLKWLTNDGSYTIAFWATKTACTVPSWYETVFGYYKYPDLSKWDDKNVHIELAMGCADYSQSTIEGNTMRVDILDDDGGKTIFDVSMDNLPGSENPVTDTWVHVVLSISTEEIKVFLDGRDPCARSGDGPPGRNRGCSDKIGVPDYSGTPWADQGAWTQTVENGAWSEGGGRGQSPGARLNEGRLGTMDMRMGVCATDINPDCLDDPGGSLAENSMDCTMFLGMIGPMATQSNIAACDIDINVMNPAAPEGTFVWKICPESCNHACPAPPPCNRYNSSDPGVTREPSPIYVGGTPRGSGFTGSINGLGLFRYPLDASQANCLFRFGEYDIHVCQDPNDMYGLFHSMTALPAPALVEEHALSWRACRRAAASEATTEGCTVVPGTAEEETAAVTTCTLTTGTAGTGGSCAIDTGSGSCDYVETAAAVSLADACTAASEVPGHCVYTAAVVEAADVEAADEACSTVQGTSGAVAVCQAACAAKGFAYAGLEFASSCGCMNDYSAGGQVVNQECDVDGDGTMDCGTFPGSDSGEFRDTCYFRVAVYDTATGAEKGCWRDPQGMPAGLTLGGDAYFDDSGRHSGQAVGRGDEDTADDFGIHFDGAGDYAAIANQDAGYAADGGFSIALWVTKGGCSASGKEEMIYRHGSRDWRNGPMIQLAIVCSNNRRHQHSTAQQGRDGTDSGTDIMRLTLRDSGTPAKVAVVDWRVGDDGGLVTDTWMHVVVGLHRTGLTVHMNGQKLRRWSFGYPVFAPTVMGGPQNNVPHGYGQRDLMLANCGAQCMGYDYIGITKTCAGPGWCSDTCMCGDAMGPAADEATCGQSPGGELCGQSACQDAPVPVPGGCSAMLGGMQAMAPAAIVTDANATWSWICNQEPHVHWPTGAPAGITFADVCPVACGICAASSPAQVSTINAQCRDVLATYEITSSGSVGPYKGCKSAQADSGNAMVPGTNNVDWQTDANAAWPSVDDMDMGGFDIDNTYGDGFDDVGTFYKFTRLTPNTTRHTLHLEGRDGGWDGYWEILSTDKYQCQGAGANATACATAGVCAMKPDVAESCVPAGHDASKCRERGRMDDNCCATPGSAACDDGYTMTISTAPCWTNSGGTFSAYTTMCTPPTMAAPSMVPDCSAFVAGDATTCAAGCAYTAPTMSCQRATLAGGPDAGQVSSANEMVEFDWTGARTGSAHCRAKRDLRQYCDVSFDTADNPTNQATCENAGDCTYSPSNALLASGEKCNAVAETRCGVDQATDQASCEALYTVGPGGTGCSYTPPDMAVVIVINVNRWGNYIKWELVDQDGKREGNGPEAQPIYLGGMPGLQRGNPMYQLIRPFTGNIADLYIFSRNPDDEDVDCMYRQQQMALGKCRQPQDLWGSVFWNELTTVPAVGPAAVTTGACTATAAASASESAACAAVTALDDSATCGAATNCAFTPAPFGRMVGQNMRVLGDAQIVDGVGLDFTSNNRQRAMPGSYTLMDGLSDRRGSATPEACMIQCKQDGFAFAGVQRGSSCYCSNSGPTTMTRYVPSPDEAASNSDGCTAPCTASVESCNNFDFATSGASCPGVTLGADATANEAACNAVNGCVYLSGRQISRSCGGTPCTGDSSRSCGGRRRNSVYVTQDVADCVTAYVAGDAVTPSTTCPTGCTFVAADAAAGTDETCLPNADAAAAALNVAYQGCYNDSPSNNFASLRNVGAFAQRAAFTVSFWFTHNYCSDIANTGTWETLFSTAGQHCDASHADGCEPQEIWIGLKCNENTTLSGVNGTVLRIILRDDNDQLVQTDLPLNQEHSNDASGGFVTRSWVHYALTVDKTTVAQYIDGVPARRYGISSWSQTAQNLAWHNRSDTGIERVGWRDDGKIQLQGNGLSSFNFTGSGHWVSLGFSHGPWGDSSFNGYMANVGLFRRALDDSEVSCMYKYGETHLGVPPRQWRQDNIYNQPIVGGGR